MLWHGDVAGTWGNCKEDRVAGAGVHRWGVRERIPHSRVGRPAKELDSVPEGTRSHGKFGVMVRMCFE